MCQILESYVLRSVVVLFRNLVEIKRSDTNRGLNSEFVSSSGLHYGENRVACNSVGN